jgi:hypothetical protein
MQVSVSDRHPVEAAFRNISYIYFIKHTAMPFGHTYTTVDGKIIGLPEISYIDALVSVADNGLNYYRVVQQNDSVIIVEHEDETLLKKDRRRIELKWDKHFNSRRYR